MAFTIIGVAVFCPWQIVVFVVVDRIEKG